MTEQIPGPMGLPFIGNLLELAFDDVRLHAFERLADTYGPIYQLRMNGSRFIICSSAEYMADLTNEKRFVKTPPGAISKGPGPHGLFASRNESPDWGQGHRILVPAFGPMAVENMFDEMKDIATQLVLKWSRHGPESRILATDDFTRLTLDTIALCAMDYRFNSFYQDQMHPFVDAMLFSLSERGVRSARPAILNTMMYKSGAKLKDCGDYMRQIARDIMSNRRANPTDKPDLLNAMLFGVDPKTGQSMREELITAQMVGFLVAGHETTSGLLSFALHNMVKNPETYHRAQQEVDEVIGQDSIQVKHLKGLKYLNAVLRETSRLTPTAPIIVKGINPELKHELVTLGNGKYLIEPNDQLLILIAKSQQDASVWGPDATEFKPERMLDENFDKLPEGVWRPFGNGVRSCIGRGFAWQESLLATAMILQNFDIRLDDPGYQMRIKQTLTIKPKDFYVRATLREGLTSTTLSDRLYGTGKSTNSAKKSMSKKVNGTALPKTSSKPISILYGSNTGTCQALAQRLATEAASHGFSPEITEMDSASERIPRDRPIFVITASYEGQPPDNAGRFVKWLENCGAGVLDGIQYAVFGCGHHDWSKTFHRIPNLVDDQMEAKGAHRFAAKGLTDVANGNIFGDFDDWLDSSVWPAIAADAEDDVNDASAPTAEISTQSRASALRYDVLPGLVKSNKMLTTPGEPAKYHMEIELPPDSAYECGDYLAVLPLNSQDSVQRIMTHFKLPGDAVVTLKSSATSTMPKDVPLSVYDVLRSYVELSQPATKRDLKVCLLHTSDPSAKEFLTSILESGEKFQISIIDNRTSIFDLLRANPSISLPFASFLTALPPLRLRQYSISSSPLNGPTSCAITYGVIDAPSFSKTDHPFQGVTGTYLSSLSNNSSIQCAVRPSVNTKFRLPSDPETTPILMFCAGTGMAPFRGFLQQRAVQLAANPDRKLARAVLFVGCRSDSRDRLFADEVDEWVKNGVVEVCYAFSQNPKHDLAQGCKYVGERMLKESEKIKELWQAGARIYICGSRGIKESVGEAARKIVRQAHLAKTGKSASHEEVENWFKDQVVERVGVDVFD